MVSIIAPCLLENDLRKWSNFPAVKRQWLLLPFCSPSTGPFSSTTDRFNRMLTDWQLSSCAFLCPWRSWCSFGCHERTEAGKIRTKPGRQECTVLDYFPEEHFVSNPFSDDRSVNAHAWSRYEKADGLVGVYREQEENSSMTLTLDLRKVS